MKEFADQLVTALTPMHPVELTMFAGILDAGNLNFVERNLALPGIASESPGR